MRALVLAVFLLAGCTSVSDPVDAVQAPGPGTYTLRALAVPDDAAAGEPFRFALIIDGSLEWTSDHIGGHWWDFATADPTADFAQHVGACAHIPGGGDVPGAYEVACTFAAAGTYYLHGHLRITNGDSVNNYWTPQITVVVA